ncbi:carotenoid ester lipase precursor [Mycena pura]|uniref:Carboxylic ester hydrolase n=1 Tax=Mycena pura TaxID=153505 RepID=A0AAD6VRI7_9AGAR|nr:carotenoid ester lipase precursor [Mycena pura]
MLYLCSIALLATFSKAQSTAPVVSIQQGNVQGFTSGSLTQFLGIPFAAPPLGALRLALPAPPHPFNGTFQAASKGPACPQQSGSLSSAFTAVVDNPVLDLLAILSAVVGDLLSLLGLGPPTTPVAPEPQEDCLTIDVILPAGSTAASKLPVIFWIYGGGFQFGSTRDNDGTTVVSRSIQLGEPVIYVAANYRVNAFGFLGGKEVKAAGVGNLGLQDQRAALRWVNQNIGAFGGDPTKVTIWGGSAGSVSVGLHMVTNGGDPEGLFRAAFMACSNLHSVSGSVIPTQDITAGQPSYDQIVSLSGCSSSSDTLACLRTVPYQTLLDAVNQTPSIFSYMSLRLAYTPWTDGVFLTENAQDLLANGEYAKIPFINGDVQDEGTLFSLSNSNITTSDETLAYIKQFWFPDASDAQIATIGTLYPDDITAGSPFNTGTLNAITPEYKRLAALQGDAFFQAPRRNMFSVTNGVVPHWSYCESLSLCVNHCQLSAKCLLNLPGDFQGADYLLNFVNNLDPNVFNNPSAAAPMSSTIFWPQYTAANGTLLTFQDGLIPLTLAQDNFRSEPIAFLEALSRQFPF